MRYLRKRLALFGVGEGVFKAGGDMALLVGLLNRGEEVDGGVPLLIVFLGSGGGMSPKIWNWNVYNRDPILCTASEPKHNSPKGDNFLSCSAEGRR